MISVEEREGQKRRRLTDEKLPILALRHMKPHVSVLFQLFHFVSVFPKSKARHCRRHATKTRCFVSVCFSFLSQTLAKNQTCFSCFSFFLTRHQTTPATFDENGVFCFSCFGLFQFLAGYIRYFLLRTAFCTFEKSHVFCVALRPVHSGCRLFLFSYLCLLLFLLGCFFWWVCYHLYYPPYFLLAFWVLVGESPQGLQ